MTDKATRIEELARIALRDHIEALEYLDVVETAEAEEMDLTEDELAVAHRLATRAHAVLPEWEGLTND